MLLALPGFILVYAYTGNLRSQNEPLVNSESMTLGWILGLVSAVIAHAIWVPVADFALRLSGSRLHVDIDSVLCIIAGEYKDGFDKYAQAFTQHAYLAAGTL